MMLNVNKTARLDILTMPTVEGKNTPVRLDGLLEFRYNVLPMIAPAMSQ
jgi:hypothetical protein